MLNFTKILIAVMFLLMTSVAILSGSQGWWWYTMRDPQVMKEYKEENIQYLQSYRTGMTQGSHVRRSGVSNRSFRSGTRSSRGK